MLVAKKKNCCLVQPCSAATARTLIADEKRDFIAREVLGRSATVPRPCWPLAPGIHHCWQEIRSCPPARLGRLMPSSVQGGDTPIPLSAAVARGLPTGSGGVRRSGEVTCARDADRAAWHNCLAGTSLHCEAASAGSLIGRSLRRPRRGAPCWQRLGRRGALDADLWAPRCPCLRMPPLPRCRQSHRHRMMPRRRG